jgi:hypothetical protein
MRVAWLLACSAIGACSGPDTAPCMADVDNACIKWTWSFIDSQGRDAMCPLEVTAASASAQAMHRNEGGGDPYYYTPSGKSDVVSCGRGELWFSTKRDASRSSLSIKSLLEGTDYDYVQVLEPVNVASDDFVELAVEVRNDLGYFGFSWSLVSDATQMPIQCPFGAMIVLVATRDGETPELHEAPCAGTTHGNTRGMPPGPYALSVQLRDSLGRVQAQTQLAAHELVGNAATELEPVVLHLP